MIAGVRHSAIVNPAGQLLLTCYVNISRMDGVVIVFFSGEFYIYKYSPSLIELILLHLLCEGTLNPDDNWF